MEELGTAALGLGFMALGLWVMLVKPTQPLGERILSFARLLINGVLVLTEWLLTGLLALVKRARGT